MNFNPIGHDVLAKYCSRRSTSFKSLVGFSTTTSSFTVVIVGSVISFSASSPIANSAMNDSSISSIARNRLTAFPSSSLSSAIPIVSGCLSKIAKCRHEAKHFSVVRAFRAHAGRRHRIGSHGRSGGSSNAAAGLPDGQRNRDVHTGADEHPA